MKMKISPERDENFKKAELTAWQCFVKITGVLQGVALVGLVISGVFLAYLFIDTRPNTAGSEQEAHCLKQLETLKNSILSEEDRNTLLVAMLAIPSLKGRGVEGDRSSYCGLLAQMKSLYHDHHIRSGGK